MAILTTQEVTTTGTAPTFVAAASGGDSGETGARKILVVKNANASSRTVTIAVPGTLETGDAYPDRQYTVPATDEIWVPLKSIYRDPTSGLAEITYSTEVDLTVAVVEV